VQPFCGGPRNDSYGFLQELTVGNRTRGFKWSLSAVLVVAPTLMGQPGGGGRPSFEQPPSNAKPGPAGERVPVPKEVRGTLVDLRPRWEQGEVIRYVMTLRSHNRIVEAKADAVAKPAPKAKLRPGQPAAVEDPAITQTLTQEITFTLRPIKVEPEAGATVDMVYERVKIHMITGEDELEFDSSKPAKGDEDNPLRMLTDGMVGAKQSIRFERDGQITSVSGGGQPGIEQALRKLGGGAGIGGGGGAGAGDLFGMIRSSGTGATLVKVGDNWTHRDELSAGAFGALSMVTNYMLRSAGSGRATVQMNGKLESKSADGPTSPVKIGPTRLMGEYIWDTARGQLLSLENEQEVQISMGGPDGTRMNSKQTMRVERQGR